MGGVDVYERSVAAAKRYLGPKGSPNAPRGKRTEIQHAWDVVKFEMYRVGWMRGHRAGSKSK